VPARAIDAFADTDVRDNLQIWLRLKPQNLPPNLPLARVS